MTDFAGMMDDAFARLARQEACLNHVFTRPRQATERRGRERITLYLTRCKLCGATYTRPTLGALHREVINRGES